MKFLADENFPKTMVELLRNRGHDVVWARHACPGSKDSGLLDRAETEARIVVTLDRDFWQLALQRSSVIKRCGIILFRVHPAVAQNLAPLVDSMLRAPYDWTGHATVITPDGIEMVPATKARGPGDAGR